MNDREFVAEILGETALSDHTLGYILGHEQALEDLRRDYVPRIPFSPKPIIIPPLRPNLDWNFVRKCPRCHASVKMEVV